MKKIIYGPEQIKYDKLTNAMRALLRYPSHKNRKKVWDILSTTPEHRRVLDYVIRLDEIAKETQDPDLFEEIERLRSQSIKRQEPVFPSLPHEFKRDKLTEAIKKHLERPTERSAKKIWNILKNTTLENERVSTYINKLINIRRDTTDRNLRLRIDNIIDQCKQTEKVVIPVPPQHKVAPEVTPHQPKVPVELEEKVPMPLKEEEKEVVGRFNLLPILAIGLGIILIMSKKEK